MDDQDLQPQTASPTYSILTYRAKDFPDRYLGLVISTWTKSLRHSNDWFRLIEPGAYYKTYRMVILNLLSKPETEIRIAVLTEDKDVAFGYCVHRAGILDYIFVLADYRRLGIGKRLMPDEVNTYTHITKIGRQLIKDKMVCGQKLNWIFNPFA
jgi:GNAT superfamily N-acetyltransferase